MATGRGNQLTKQIGEYLVACELARRGFIVATFSGNVPDFDIIATDKRSSSCPIQVKTTNTGTWQFSIDRFAEIIFAGNMQIIGKPKPLTVPGLICVFVIAGESYGQDKFYILEWSKVRDIIIRHHAQWLSSHGGVRPKKPDSLHCAIKVNAIEEFQNQWSIIADKLVSM